MLCMSLLGQVLGLCDFSFLYCVHYCDVDVYIHITKGLFKVTVSHVGLNCKCDNISETAQDKSVFTTDH